MEASQEVDAVEGNIGPSIHAPWRMISNFQIGFDMPLLLLNVSKSEEDFDHE